jgi:hypothetical protein
MAQPGTRHHLTREDAQLAIRLVAHESGEDERRLHERLADEGLDAVLDDPRLPAAILRDAQGALVSLPLLTYVMVRAVLRRFGEEDRQLTDYVAGIVPEFGVRDRAHRVGEGDDEVYDTLAALLRDAEDRDSRRAYLVRAHLGAYALWLSGLFPDRIEHRRWWRGGPDLTYYEAIGRRGFELAAGHTLARQQGMSELYAAAAARFVTLRVALTALSDALFFPHVHTPERLMRQVSDEARWQMLQ